MIKVLFSVILGCSALFASAQFTEGIEAFNKKKYAKARDYFSNALEKEETVALHFNIGLTYFEEKKYVAALNSFENALKINPNFEDAMLNASITKDKIEADAIWSHPYTWLERFIYSVSSKYWIIVIYTCSILLAVALFLLLISKKRRNLYLLIALITVFVLPLSVYGLNELEKHINVKEYCYSKSKTTTLLLSPNGLEQPDKMEYGKRYAINKQSDNFFQIETEKKRLFWVEKEDVYYY